MWDESNSSLPTGYTCPIGKDSLEKTKKTVESVLIKLFLYCDYLFSSRRVAANSGQQHAVVQQQHAVGLSREKYSSTMQ